MAGVTVTTPPTIEPLTAADIKTYCRVQDDDDLDILLMMGKTARQFCEEFTNRAIVTQTLTMFLDAIDDRDDPLFEGVRTGPYLNYYKNYITLFVSIMSYNRCPVFQRNPKIYVIFK